MLISLTIKGLKLIRKVAVNKYKLCHVSNLS